MKVLITGASRGIGLAIATEFAKNGHEVAVSSRSQEKLSEAKQSILDKYPSAQINTFVSDASSTEAVKQLAQSILNLWGSCDILVNNAGVFIPGAVHDEPDGHLEMMMATNLYSAYHMSRAVLPSMLKRKSGDIVNICSIASNTAYANGGSYSISKFAMYGFSKNLREEMKPHGIRVMAVLPGGVYTDSWAGSGVEEQRIMPAEDIAKLVYSACSLSRRSVIEDIIVRPQLGDL